MARKAQPRALDETAGVETPVARLLDRREQAIVRAFALAASGGKAGLSVLDVPSGRGRFAEVLREHAGSLVELDLSGARATRARRKAGATARAAIADIRSLPFADRSFDLVVSIDLLHHFPAPGDRDAMLRELLRVCRAHLVISYYDRTPLHRARRAVGALLRPSRRKKRVVFFGTKAFKREAADAGWEVLATRAPMRALHAQRFALLRRPIEADPARIAGELANAAQASEARDWERAIWALLAAREHGADPAKVDDDLWRLCVTRAALEKDAMRKRESFMRYKTFCPAGRHVPELESLRFEDER